MDEIKVDKDEFLRLIYLLAENHFKYNDIDVTLIPHYEDFINDGNIQISFTVTTHNTPYVVSRTISSYGVLENGAITYLTSLFFMKQIPFMGIPINEHNFELLKMLTALSKEEMELWMKLK